MINANSNLKGSKSILKCVAYYVKRTLHSINAHQKVMRSSTYLQSPIVATVKKSLRTARRSFNWLWWAFPLWIMKAHIWSSCYSTSFPCLSVFLPSLSFYSLSSFCFLDLPCAAFPSWGTPLICPLFQQPWHDCIDSRKNRPSFRVTRSSLLGIWLKKGPVEGEIVLSSERDSLKKVGKMRQVSRDCSFEAKSPW